MFWRMAGPAQPSPIEAILDKENYTLEELLDEDDLIQEVTARSSELRVLGVEARQRPTWTRRSTRWRSFWMRMTSSRR